MDLTNNLRTTLKNGDTAVGVFTSIASPEIVELLGLTGFDFVLFDAEHGPLSPETVYPMLLAAEVHDLPTVVRVGQNDRQVLLKFLDLGVGGVMVPQTNTPADARRAIEALRYVPRGIRGLAGARHFNWGMTGPLNELVDPINERTLSIVQFENIDALDHVEEICQIPDLDVLFVGPNDLAQSMGFPGQPGHPDVQAIIDQVVARAKAVGMPLGTVAADAATTNRQLERGFQMVATNVPALFGLGIKQYLGGIQRPDAG